MHARRTTSKTSVCWCRNGLVILSEDRRTRSDKSLHGRKGAPSRLTGRRTLRRLKYGERPVNDVTQRQVRSALGVAQAGLILSDVECCCQVCDGDVAAAINRRAATVTYISGTILLHMKITTADETSVFVVSSSSAFPKRSRTGEERDAIDSPIMASGQPRSSIQAPFELGAPPENQPLISHARRVSTSHTRRFFLVHMGNAD